MPLVVEIRGARELQAKLNKLADIGATLKPALVQSAQEVLQTLKTYPPASEANLPPSPPPGYYYERGKGQWYVYAGAKVHGGKKKVSRGGRRLIKPSQMLNRSWSVVYSFSASQAEATIGTRVTYAKYVHHRDYQPAYHARRGWQTVQDVAERLGPAIAKRVDAAIEAALR